MHKLVFVIPVSILLAGCSTSGSLYTSNGENHYLQSRNGSSLIIPHPLTDSNISHFYDLPPQNQDARVSIEPPKTKGDQHGEKNG